MRRKALKAYKKQDGQAGLTGSIMAVFSGRMEKQKDYLI